MSQKSKKKGVLAQKIAEEFFSTTPHIADTEDIVDNDDTNARALDFDSEGDDGESTLIQESVLRKRNVALLEDIDEKYVGKKVSRKTIYPEETHFSGSEDELELERDDMELDFVDADGGDASMDDGNEESDGYDDATSNEGSVAELDNDDDYDDKGSADDSKDSDSDDDDLYDEDISTFLRKAKIASLKGQLEEEEGDGGSGEGEGDSDEEEVAALKKAELKKEAKKSRIDAELQRSLAVQNQIRIWEQLLEMRIEIQKILTSANRLPQFDVWDQLQDHPEILPSRRLIDTRFACLELCSHLLDLQRVLEGNESHERGSKQKLDDINEDISEHFETAQGKRNDDIQKWDDKTRLTRLSKKNSDVPTQSVLKQISHVLGNRSRVLTRTRQKRNHLQPIGQPELPPLVRGPRKGEENPEMPVDEVDEISDLDPEIYNDDDFYQQLLRELIQQKTSGDPLMLSDQWLKFQNEKKKNRRVVDTSASKGRKLRFDIKPKLVNYMASYRDPTHWDDSRRDDLFASLFGKKPKYMKKDDDEENNAPEPITLQEGEPLILR